MYKLIRTCLALGLAGALGALSSCGAEDPAACPDPASCPDGLSAQSTPLSDPSQPGPRRTARFDLAVPLAGGGAALRVTVTGPSDDGKTLSMTGAPHPLVVLSPGFTLPRAQYSGYADRLASHGIVTVTQSARSETNHAQYRDDTRKLLDWLIAPTGSAAAGIKGRVDSARLGVAGHSLGGKISLLVAAQDARIKGVIGIDPVDGGAAPQAKDVIGKIHLPASAPIGLLGETISAAGGAQPCAPADRNYQTLYSAAPAPVFAIRFLKAAHMDFLDRPSSCFQCLFCTGGTGQARTHDLSIKYVTAYFLATLGGQPGQRTYLTGAELQKDAATGDVSGQNR